MNTNNGYSIYGQNMKINKNDTQFKNKNNNNNNHNDKNNYPNLDGKNPNQSENINITLNKKETNETNLNDFKPELSDKKYSDLKIKTIFNDDNDNNVSSDDLKLQSELDSIINQYLSIINNINNQDANSSKGNNNFDIKLTTIKNRLNQVDEFNGKKFNNFISQLKEISNDDSLLNITYDSFKNNNKEINDQIKKTINNFKYDIVLYKNKKNKPEIYKKLNDYINQKKGKNNINYNNNSNLNDNKNNNKINQGSSVQNNNNNFVNINNNISGNINILNQKNVFNLNINLISQNSMNDDAKNLLNNNKEDNNLNNQNNSNMNKFTNELNKNNFIQNDFNRNKKIDQISNIEDNNQTYSFSRYKNAAKTGLKNLGDTSYLNSVLQIFGTVKHLSSYFLNPKNKKTFEDNVNEDKTHICNEFHNLFTHFYPYPEKIGEIYNPEALLQALGKINLVYNTNKFRNPNELIFFCLNRLHIELNLNEYKNISNINFLDKSQVINEKLNNFVLSNNSIISNYFDWFEIKTKLCPICNNNFYELRNFESLELDILGAYSKFKSPFTLTQCLEFQKQKIQISFCKICKKYTNFIININIYSSPIYFIFSLNRGDHDKNLLNINLQIEENINISQFLENKTSPNKYELIGIVSVYKTEDFKYVCFGKSPVDKKWYIYNDENVSDITIEQAIYLNNNMEYIPCILLYQCKK